MHIDARPDIHLAIEHLPDQPLVPILIAASTYVLPLLQAQGNHHDNRRSQQARRGKAFHPERSPPRASLPKAMQTPTAMRYPALRGKGGHTRWPIITHCSPPAAKKFITIGEIMLRLTPPNYDKIRVASMFEASYGGSEANIALALANLGVDSTFFSVVPDNSLGKSAVRWLRSNDVDCTPMIFSTPEQTPTHRLGTYFLETGYGIRSSEVIYDRKHSAITEYDFSGLDLDELLDGFDWLHLSGITPALAPNCRQLVLSSLKAARAKGMTISFDGNFRSSLWTWEQARDFCTLCLPYIDVLLGIEPYHLWRDETIIARAM